MASKIERDEWLERFSIRLSELSPTFATGDCVRFALGAYTSAAHLPPELSAEALFSQLADTSAVAPRAEWLLLFSMALACGSARLDFEHAALAAALVYREACKLPPLIVATLYIKQLASEA